ncbi:MAG: TolC family protein [Bacteroidia bacterium]
MLIKTINKNVIFSMIIVFLWGCKTPQSTIKTENTNVPLSYINSTDTTNTALLKWKTYFSDQNLIALIDTALKNNQELNITLQEIEISKNEIRTRKGEYLPFLGLKGGAGSEKTARYTRNGSVEHNLDIKPGVEFPEPLSDFMFGANATWEVDIWKKLRNAKKAAVSKYLASIEGKNFMITNVIAEIADTYYELMALDNLLDIVDRNIETRSNALKVVKQQKEAAKVTQLAVNRFEAQLLNTQNLQYEIKQKITEAENRIIFLTGGFSKNIPRSSLEFDNLNVGEIQEGIPSQLLSNRPDIRKAEFNLVAAKLNVQVARANFYPSLGISANVGFQAFNPAFLINPQSMLYNIAGDLMAPLINRNAIKAAYSTSKAQQIQAVYSYEQTILNAYVDVLNQLAKLNNYSESYKTKSKQVDILMQSVGIANNLFNSARADYAEVLLTQREALDSKMELIEIKLKQMNAKVNIYRALGGGWN